MKYFATTIQHPTVHACEDYVHVSDLARAHLAALDYLRDGGESDAYAAMDGVFSQRSVDAVRRSRELISKFAKHPVEREIPPQLWHNSDQLMKLGNGKPELNIYQQ